MKNHIEKIVETKKKCIVCGKFLFEVAPNYCLCLNCLEKKKGEVKHESD